MAASIPKYHYLCLIVRLKIWLSWRNFVIFFKIKVYNCLNNSCLSNTSTIFSLISFAGYSIWVPLKLALNINMLENRPVALAIQVSSSWQSVKAWETKSWSVPDLVGRFALATAHEQAYVEVSKGFVSAAVFLSVKEALHFGSLSTSIKCYVTKYYVYKNVFYTRLRDSNRNEHTGTSEASRQAAQCRSPQSHHPPRPSSFADSSLLFSLTYTQRSWAALKGRVCWQLHRTGGCKLVLRPQGKKNPSGAVRFFKQIWFVDD